MKYIKGYDGLRAFSIILVLLTHLGLYAWLPENDFIRNRVWLLLSGTTGVNIFFSLSGFLITYILFSEKALRGRISLLRFYTKRFLRLLPPLLIFYTALVALMNFRMVTPAMGAVLLSCFYMYNFAPETFLRAELSHTWSLAVEEQFYLFWPFVIGYFSPRKAIYCAGIIVGLCIAGKYLLPHMHVTSLYGNTVYLDPLFNLDRWLIPAVAPIMIGSCFSIMILYRKERVLSIMRQGGVVFFISFCLFISPTYVPDFLLPVSYIFQALGISGILLWIFFNQDSRASEVLEFKPLAYLGKISYGVYVYQGIFLTTGPQPDGLQMQRFPLNIILTLLVSVLSYELLEKRALRLKGKISIA